MRETIEYYYKINNFIMNNNDSKFIILYKNELYIVEKIVDIDMLIYVLKFNHKFPMYKVILTVNNSMYFEYNHDKYILYKAINVSKPVDNNFIFPIIDTEKLSNSISIWENNIDYFKKEVSKLNYKSINLIDNINYYIGMAENALYLYGIGDSIDMQARITLSHYRIRLPNINLFYLNPNNIVIDYISRDIAEYIKVSFFEENICVDDAFKLIKKYVLNDREIYYLAARLMFPTYFFDNVDNLNKLKNILIKRSDYQLFVKDLFEQIKTANLNINVSWL